MASVSSDLGDTWEFDGADWRYADRAKPLRSPVAWALQTAASGLRGGAGPAIWTWRRVGRDSRIHQPPKDAFDRCLEAGIIKSNDAVSAADHGRLTARRRLEAPIDDPFENHPDRVEDCGQYQRADDRGRVGCVTGSAQEDPLKQDDESRV